MLLYNVTSMPSDALQRLFFSESKKFTDALGTLPMNDVQGIRQNLKIIVDELDNRRMKENHSYKHFPF